MNRYCLFLAAIALLVLCFAFACDSDDDDDNDNNDDNNDDDDTPVDDDDNDTSDDDNDDATPDDDSVDDDTADDDTAPPPAYDPAEPGPYEVGNATILFVDEARYDPVTNGPRTIPVEFWYPAVDEASELPRDTLLNFFGQWDDELIELLEDEGVPPEEIANFSAETGSARNAPPNRDHGPFPVILFSHGNGGTRFQSFTLSEYLAGHGFVVVAPDHTGNSLAAPLPDQLVVFDEKWVFISYWYRKGDLKFLIDKLLELSLDDRAGPLFGLIDMDRLGVMGHSFGGTVAVETTKDVPRIRACIDFSSFMFPWFAKPFDASLMWMIGREDNTMGDIIPLMRFDWRIAPPPKFRLEFYDGGHYTFTDACILVPSILGEEDGCGMGERRWGGAPFEYIEHDYAFSIIDAYATAFFGFNLRGDDHMAEYLTANHFPDDVNYHQRWPEE